MTAERTQSEEIKQLAEERDKAREELEQKRHEIQALMRRVVVVQEEERRHLARELHDEMVQLLTGLHFLLDKAIATGADLHEALSIVQDLISRVRNVSLDLRPAMLDDLGLMPTLVWHCDRYSRRTNVHVKLTEEGIGERRFAPEVETAAYRIVQEALTNVARHTGVHEVAVHLWVPGDVLCVRIEDGGDGFDVDAVLAVPRSTGIPGMRERAMLLGGKVTVTSIPGDGVCVTAELPLRPFEP